MNNFPPRVPPVELYDLSSCTIIVDKSRGPTHHRPAPCSIPGRTVTDRRKGSEPCEPLPPPPLGTDYCVRVHPTHLFVPTSRDLTDHMIVHLLPYRMDHFPPGKGMGVLPLPVTERVRFLLRTSADPDWMGPGRPSGGSWRGKDLGNGTIFLFQRAPSSLRGKP